MNNPTIVVREYAIEAEPAGMNEYHLTATSLRVTGGDAPGASGYAQAPEAILGRRLAPGSRLRVTVEVIEEVAWDPTAHRGFKHQRDPSGQCRSCVEERPDRFVKLACGHGVIAWKWERDGRPVQMQCWDAWAPGPDGWQDVVRVPAAAAAGKLG